MAIFQLTTLSQSSLQDYVDCQRRFKLRYLDRLSYPAAETEPALENEKHQQEGEYFHRLIQQHLVGIPAEQVGRLANTPTLQKWWDNFVGFSKSTLTDEARYLPEVTLSAPLGGHRLVAKYDLIAVRDGKAVIYDWKTYRRRPRTEWLSARMQTRVYRALLVQAGTHLNNGRPFEPEQIEMVYWFADFPDDPARFPYSSAQFKRDWDALTKLEQEIPTNIGDGQDITAAFPLTDDRQKCVYCTYRSYCERGVEAGDFESAEAEMEAESLFDVDFEQICEIAF